MLAKAASANNATAIASFGLRIAALNKKPRICILLKMGAAGQAQILTGLLDRSRIPRRTLDPRLGIPPPYALGAALTSCSICEVENPGKLYDVQGNHAKVSVLRVY